MLLAYVRCSTEEQAQKSSPADQERVCRGVAMIKGINTYDVAVYNDAGVSGSIALRERPSGLQMIRDAKKGDIICAAKFDRIFRSAVDALQTAELLQERGVHLVLADMSTDPVTGSGTGKLFFSMLAAFAEFERHRINERTSDGRRAKRAKRGFMGGEPPYGYSRAGKGSHARLVKNVQEQELMQLAATLAKERAAEARNEPRGFNIGPNHYWHLVRDDLHSQGYLSRTGKPFQTVQVQRMAERASA